MSNLPIKQLKINGQKFIPYSDTLVGDADNKVYKKITDESGERLVELVSTTDLDSKLDKNNGVATGRLKVKASDTEVPGIMVTTAGDNEDRWFSKLTQDQIEARREYNKESEIYEFFDNENGNKIARYKDTIIANQDNNDKSISLIKTSEENISIKVKEGNEWHSNSSELNTSSLSILNDQTTNQTYDYTESSLTSTLLLMTTYNSDQVPGGGPYNSHAIGIHSDGLSKIITSGQHGPEGYEDKKEYNYSFPDKTGTLALKEDITDIASELTKLDENGTYQIKDLVKIINDLLGLLGAKEYTIDL